MTDDFGEELEETALPEEEPKGAGSKAMVIRLVILVVLVIVLGVGGYFLYKKMKAPDPAKLERAAALEKAAKKDPWIDLMGDLQKQGKILAPVPVEDKPSGGGPEVGANRPKENPLIWVDELKLDKSPQDERVLSIHLINLSPETLQDALVEFTFRNARKEVVAKRVVNPLVVTGSFNGDLVRPLNSGKARRFLLSLHGIPENLTALPEWKVVRHAATLSTEARPAGSAEEGEEDLSFGKTSVAAAPAPARPAAGKRESKPPSAAH
ncbi:MAG: hypothetical protein HQL56_02630 [Magnetococcales bacterium]|nr:hypothetical protein [Magnetococcales bacterium]